MKIANKKILPWFVLPVLILTSCVKDISIPQPDYTPRATIQCSLEPGTVPILYFYRTIPYFAQTGTSLHDLFIKDALVRISSQDTIDNLKIDSTYNYIKCEYEYFYKGSVITRRNR